MNKKLTIKQFRQILNTRYGHVLQGQGDSNRYKAITREYGDYLYFQDRDMFNDIMRRYVNGEPDVVNELNAPPMKNQN